MASTFSAGGFGAGTGPESIWQAFDQLRATFEKRVGGRLGVAVLDTSNATRIDYRQDERFPMCSTFKFLAAAATLERVDAKKERIDRRVAYGEKDLLDYAPITKQNVREDAMTLSALCAAALEYSDNTAGNLLLRELGGTAAVTRYARSINDDTTRLDRNEPTVNTALPGDVRDTTTPAAMVADMRTILLGEALSEASRQQLIAWLVANTTGNARLRAGVPEAPVRGRRRRRAPQGCGRRPPVAGLRGPPRLGLLALGHAGPQPDPCPGAGRLHHAALPLDHGLDHAGRPQLGLAQPHLDRADRLDVAKLRTDRRIVATGSDPVEHIAFERGEVHRGTHTNLSMIFTALERLPGWLSRTRLKRRWKVLKKSRSSLTRLT